MSSDAKASTAGSNQRQATGLGRIFRGARGTRAASPRVSGGGASQARRVVLPVGGFAALLAVLVFVASASATKTHLFKEVFGSVEQPTFSADKGIALDQGAERLYVIDSTADTLSRYFPNGTFSSFAALGSNAIDGEGTGDETPQGHLAFSATRQREQVATDESGEATDGNIYVTQSALGVVDIFNPGGEYLGQLSESTAGGAFGEPCGVAVDENGLVYVGDRGDDMIHVYAPAANPPVNGDNTTSFETVTDPCAIAAGTGPTAGFIFVNTSAGAISKLDAATGEVKYAINTGGSAVTVDPGSGYLYAARNTGSSSTVDKYDASGAGEATLLSSFKPGSTAEGVAVDAASEEVYVSRSSSSTIAVYGPTVTVPDVVTEEPSSNTGVRATLAGTVNPDGVELDECFFEWDVNGGSSYGNIAPCAETPAEIGTGTSPVAVHADITGLHPQGGTTPLTDPGHYQYRLVAVNPNATVNGSKQIFVTADTVFTEAASGIAPTAATLNGTVNPDGAELDECFFEWGPEKGPLEEVQTFPETAPCVPGPSGIGSGTSPVAVQADLSGLEIGTVYRYRLKAVYPSGTALDEEDEALQTTGPTIVGAWSEGVVFSEAVLKAQINPQGAATTYHFEYGTSAAYGQETPELAVGSDSSDHEVTNFLDGLQPGTTYHYRLILTNSVTPNESPDLTFTTFAPPALDTDCPNQAFRGGAAGRLPDCRAYEMVSPIDKGGSDIKTLCQVACVRTSANQSSLSGDKITYSSSQSFGDAVGSYYSNQYIATRGADGWSTHGISPPNSITVSSPSFSFNDLEVKFKAFTDDLSMAWLFDGSVPPLTPDAQDDSRNLFRRDNVNESYEAITNAEPLLPQPNPFLGDPALGGISRDGSHTVFDTFAPFTPDALPNNNSEVYDFSDGELHLVSVLPSGSANPGHSYVGVHFNSTIPERLNGVYHAVSEDGSRIFWTAASAGSGEGRVYVRIDNETTLPVSETHSTGPAFFLNASTDGSKALVKFASGVQSTGDLYEVDVDSETPTLIAARAKGVLGVSDDLSYIYFTSQEALTPDATGAWKLYLRHNGTTSFIAELTNQDVNLSSETLPTQTGVDSNSPLRHNSRVTADGRHLAFASHARLTGYDNTDANNGAADMEVYRYDADSAELTCASCNPSGARPVGQPMREPYTGYDGFLVEGPPEIGAKQWAAAWLTTTSSQLYAPHALSEDGNRLFFNAFDALVPEDTNGVQDVYEWEAQGSGTCDRAGGCISLISTGQSAKKSEFVDASADGRDVFFETNSDIDPRDPGLIDIYDARVNGGFPYTPPVEACVGDSCQSIPAAPNDPTPASASFKGAGNPVAARDCATAARGAAKLSRQAKRLRRRAGRASDPRQAKRLRRRARRNAKRAKRLSANAKRCRRANRRAGR